jgi:membrane-bound serine protease (ClpP class)
METVSSKMKHLLLILIFLGMGSVLLAEQAVTVKKKNLPEKVSKVYIIEMKEEIAPPMRRKVQKGLREARENGADLIIIHMNTYGGTLDAADSIRTMILTSSIPVWVFIDNNAASAGALISIACDSIYMRPGANIGAATVVDQTGGALPDKYQSYMRSMMRSTAEAKGRDPQIAQAMVDTRIVVPGIDDSTTVITFTTSEAIKYGFCEGESENIQEILQKYGWDDAIIITQKLSGVDKIINFLINPIVSAILIMMIIGGIYFELQTPGIGFPLAVAILGAILYFAPLYLEGLAAHWEILLFIIGLILIAIEIFAIPGFGVTGIIGIILVVTGLTLSLVGNFRDIPAGLIAQDILKAFFTVVIAAFISLIISFYGSKRLFSHPVPFLGNLALDTTQDKELGYTIADKDYSSMIGRTGFALTILRPAGKIKIEEEVFDAVAINGYISMGQEVEVMRYENAQLYVKVKN